VRPAFIERRASGGDAGCLGALATRVFLDTNATDGITRELANEARSVYSPQVFAARLQDAAVEIVVAQRARPSSDSSTTWASRST